MLHKLQNIFRWFNQCINIKIPTIKKAYTNDLFYIHTCLNEHGAFICCCEYYILFKWEQPKKRFANDSATKIRVNVFCCFWFCRSFASCFSSLVILSLFHLVWIWFSFDFGFNFSIDKLFIASTALWVAFFESSVWFAIEWIRCVAKAIKWSGFATLQHAKRNQFVHVTWNKIFHLSHNKNNDKKCLDYHKKFSSIFVFLLDNIYLNGFSIWIE